MMTQSRNVHQECWLVLPWLATGRLAASERVVAQEHVRTCSACTAELERQYLLCAALTEPERVTHAPGPSFRKLMERIDTVAPARAAPLRRLPRARRLGPALAATWRPPGLAWAATFVFALALGLASPTLYRWSQPAYSTYTSTPQAHGAVLHIALARSLTVGEVAELLRSSGARIVEGPDSTGIFGVAPVAAAGGAAPGSPQLRAIAARLRTDARVRWIEPLPRDPAAPEAPGPKPAQP
jgi:hypothetical protein